MNTHENGPDPILDRAIDEIRNEQIDPAEVDQAADRVWARLSEEAASGHETIRDCSGYRALMPAYRDGKLSPERALLLEDHTHECPACRKALAAAKGASPVTVMPVRRAPIPVWRWAAAAAVVVSAGLSVWYGAGRLMTPSGPRATVQTVSGTLYGAQTPVATGTALAESQVVRTAKASQAMLRLRDGSLVELRERTEVSVTEDRKGATVHLNGGSIIVHAAKQRSKHLFVGTDDCTVSVTGTIFSVTNGLKGSRVSVIEGEVHVAQGKEEQVLRPGDQVSTSAALTPVPLQEDFAWSQNVDQYIALMKEFTALRKKIEAVPGPGLRYSSRLLDLAPENTLFYASIPNLGPTLSEANRIFHEQLGQSPVLQQWWSQKMKTPADEAKLNDAIDRLRTFSDYLGQEIVVVLAPDTAGKQEPLVMAEIARSGFREYLEQEIKKIAAEHGGQDGIRIVDDPRRVAGTGKELLIWISGNMVAASTDAAQLVKVATPTRAFAATPFYARIASAYRDGVGWLFAADLQSLMQRENKAPDATLSRAGFSDIRYLIAQRKDIAGQAAENRAVITFAQARQGIASWLAAPAPIRALDYVSPDASAAAGFVLKNPALAMQEAMRIFPAPDFLRGLSEFEAKTGLNVQADIMQPLGGEVAFAIDGPLLPVPSWKLVLEVNDDARFQQALEKLVAAANREMPQAAAIAKETVGGRTYYSLSAAQQKVEAHWTYDSGFLVAAASRDLVTRALQNRAAGYSLQRSSKFMALLPADRHTNFSGAVYHAVGSLLAPLANTVQLTPEQKKSLEAVAGADTPTLVLLYGEQDRIEVASKGTLFGVGLEKFLGLEPAKRNKVQKRIKTPA